MLPGRCVAVGQRAQRKSERQLRLMSDCATVLIEMPDGAAQMQRRLLVKLRCHCVMLGRGRAAFDGARRSGHYQRRTGVVFEGVVRPVDGVQRMTVRHHRLMCGVGEVFACLEMP